MRSRPLNSVHNSFLLFAALVIVLSFLPGVTSAGIISATSLFRTSPDGAWSYAESPSPQTPGLDISYYPKSRTEYAAATFQGYVVPDPDQVAITGGESWFGSGQAAFQIFTTHIQSNSDQTVAINVAGDDGHSLFVDDAFVAGGAFAAPVQVDLALSAGVSRKIEMAGYNGPANWSFAIGIPTSRPLPAEHPIFMGTIESIPGVRISANDVFVPEPDAATLGGIAAGCVLIFAVRRRYLLESVVVSSGN